MTPFALFLIAAAAAALLTVLWLDAKRRASQKDANAARAAYTKSAARAAELESALVRLARFEGVANAAEEAERILADASRAADALRSEATATREAAAAEASDVRGQARSDAQRTVAAAKERSETLEAQARVLLEDARQRASEIVAEAARKADDLAGDARLALETRRENEDAAAAMANVIDGYGDRYLIPGRSLLDDLADGFGHTEAGLRLKETRDRVRRMVQLGQAATCDYVEPHRRTTAIRFVIDAFNGKVDTILAMVKHDNAGTLQQQVRDAFALVNHNGAAFRNARITPTYFEARLEELRWAAAAQELRLQEREEQRRIKDQIREEEKARREFERAIREAAKEEELVKKAMEKAEGQLARASDEQRAKLEEQLVVLTARLQEAEARNQRALSMAQQTRRGHVYIISNVGSFGEHVYKIGLTRRLDPIDRIRELGDSSVPFEFDVHALIFSEDAPALEHRLHKHFVLGQVNKVNHRKEFFRVQLADLRSQLEAMSIVAQWTMTAAARDYRESLAIEAAIKDNPAAREAWVKRQLLLEASNPFEADEDKPTVAKDPTPNGEVALAASLAMEKVPAEVQRTVS
jgi:hypothetical protein